MPVYLKIDGLTGGVTSQDYKGQMSIANYSWGFTVPVSTSGGTGADRQGAGKVQVGELHLVKRQDTATVQLMQNSFGGTPMKSAVLTVTRHNKGKEDKIMEYKMDNIYLSSYQTSGSDSGEPPSEQMSIHFSKIDIGQFSVDKGGAASAPTRAAYDFETNTKA